MEMETFYRILEMLGVGIAGGWISRVLTIRARVRHENAEANKTEVEVTAEHINNIEAIVAKVYQPTIDHLEKQVAKLTGEVEKLREENSQKQDEIDALKVENEQLRDAIREIRPDVVPSKRSINASKQARGENGQFVKAGE